MMGCYLTLNRDKQLKFAPVHRIELLALRVRLVLAKRLLYRESQSFYYSQVKESYAARQRVKLHAELERQLDFRLSQYISYLSSRSLTKEMKRRDNHSPKASRKGDSFIR